MAERVLIAEDNTALREWIVSQLRAAGFNAAGVADGLKALSISLNTTPDALVLDLQLPGMNGIEVLRNLRASPNGKNLPVIVITGVYKGKEHALKARKAFGIDAYIEKPFRIEALVDALKKAISSNRNKQQMKEPQRPISAAPPRPEKKVFVGNLYETPFDHLLLKLWNEHHTGILRVKSHDGEESGEMGIERAFAFLSGRPVLGRSNAENEDFGTHLLSRGIITPDENREFQYLRSRAARDAEDIFIRMGCVTPDGFIIERVRHLEEMLIHCFALAEGEFRFEENDLEIGAIAGALVPRVIHEGYRRHLSEQRMGLLFQSYGTNYLCRTVKFYDHFPTLELDAEEMAMSEGVDGCRMLKDHVEGGHFYKGLKLLATFMALDMVEPCPGPKTEKIGPPYPVRKAATPEPLSAKGVQLSASAPIKEEKQAPRSAVDEAALLESEAFEDLGAALSDELGNLAGDLDLEAPAPSSPQAAIHESPVEKEHEELSVKLAKEAEKIKNLNYYEYFDSKPNKFRFDEMKKVYFEKRKIFSPENFIGWADGEMISLAEQVFSQLTTAYNTLSNVVSKEKYDELIESTLPKVSGDAKVDRFQAQVQFESGKAFVEMGEWDSATQSLREAIDLNPKEAAYHAWLGWAVYNKAKTVPSNVKQAKEELAAAIRMDPRLSIAFAFKGTMFLDEDNLDMAEIELKRALKFNPQSKHAKKSLRELEERRENQKKGLLGRIFS